MFCKNCGKEIEDGAKFCPSCGAAVEAANAESGESAESRTETPEAAKEGNESPKPDTSGKGAPNSDQAAGGQGGASVGETVKDTLGSVSDGIEGTNPICIAGLVLTIIMFFFNSYGVVGFAALVLSLWGYMAAKKNGQKGTLLAIVCMAVSGVISLIFIIRLIEYSLYESAVNGVLEWLDDLL